jgi:hypothetical protein
MQAETSNLKKCHPHIFLPIPIAASQIFKQPFLYPCYLRPPLPDFKKKEKKRKKKLTIATI